MFQDEYEISNPALARECSALMDKWLEQFEPISIESVIAESWLVDWLWNEMQERAAIRSDHTRHLWYRGVSMGEIAKRTGISKGRVSKIIHGRN